MKPPSGRARFPLGEPPRSWLSLPPEIRPIADRGMAGAEA